MYAELRRLGAWYLFLTFYLTDCFQCAAKRSCDIYHEPKNPYSSPRSVSHPSDENTPDGPRTSDASEKRLQTETPLYIHHPTHGPSTKGALCRETWKAPWPNQNTDRSSTGTHCDHVERREGTELVSVRVERSVVVGVGPWRAEPSDEQSEPCRKPEVKWGQGLM